MFPHKVPFGPQLLAACMVTIFSPHTMAEVKISYGTPEGFSAVEMDNSAIYVATYNGKTLPGFISYSLATNGLVFDAKQYAENGIDPDDRHVIENVLSKVDYKQCKDGCDLRVADHYVTLDKTRRTLSIRSSREDYLAPETTWGLINNQSLDVRGSTESYSVFNMSGNTWFGLPGRSFGYMNWYANRSQNRGQSTHDQGVSSYYLQKNFADTYVRAGKQNSIDYGSGSVSTVLSPSFDQFITLGSQGYMRSNQDVGSLVLFSTAEGNYEFYRNGRLILTRPAILGRNEISFMDLPGGYYPIEIRLVDRNGNLINQETQDINNLNFGGAGANSWRVTAGQDMDEGGQLLEAAVSRNMSQFYLNAAAVSGENSDWASEINVTRPSSFGTLSVDPTVGVLSGENGTGGYFNLNMNDPVLGNLMLSRYQNTDVSRFYYGTPSSSLSYSKNVAGVTLGYNYRDYGRGETQQVEVRWNYKPNGLWSTFAAGVQKGNSMPGERDYTVYLNMTWMLDKSQASVRAAQYGGKTQLSGDYRKDYDDSFGTTTAGVTVNRIDSTNSFNAYGSRAGTRGDASLNVGHSDSTSNLDFNYRGMFAANAEGVALGRYSNDGSAMLLQTPALGETPYGFRVEGQPVAGGSTYAVPLNQYTNVSFARVASDSENMDMNIEVPANIVRAHPGQVYSAKAKVDINMIYSGILVNVSGQPVGGTIQETGDTAYANGLFSISSKAVLTHISIDAAGRRYTCDLSKPLKPSHYLCQ